MTRAALDLQVGTFMRSTVAVIVTALAVLAPPAFSLGFVALARSGTVTGPSAGQFEPYAEGTVAEATALLSGQIATVVMLLAAGFAVIWLFGREWADRTYGSLFGLAVSRGSIAAAKVAVVLGWAVAAVSAAVLLTAAGIAVVDAGNVTSDVVIQLGRTWLAALLLGALGLPLAWVAVRTRGYLGAAGALIGLTAVSQILASLGWGAWVPFVSPAVWAGAAGPQAAANIHVVHLAWAAAFAAMGAWAAIHAFGRARLD